MNIEYKDIKTFSCEELQDLFLSVGWSSGNYPDKLAVAMENSSTVLSAWDGKQLVGLINVLDDGIMTAYIHYLLIKPTHQHVGIGGKLIKMIAEKYKNFLRIVLIAYDKETEFYERYGFEIGKEKTPMFITTLWT